MSKIKFDDKIKKLILNDLSRHNESIIELLSVDECSILPNGKESHNTENFITLRTEKNLAIYSKKIQRLYLLRKDSDIGSRYNCWYLFDNEQDRIIDRVILESLEFIDEKINAKVIFTCTH